MSLRALVETFASKRILLVGDTILDIYTYGRAMGLSSETPTIVGRKERETCTLGGAGFVCENLLALGAQVTFATLVGDDEESQRVTGVRRNGLTLVPVTAPGRRTTVKHRFWMDGYKLFQLDTRDDTPISPALAAAAAARIVPLIANCDAMIISDYRHGFLTPELAAELTAAARKAGKAVYVDSQVAQLASNHLQYRPGAIMCLNLKEARCLDSGFEPKPSVSAFAKLAGLLETDRIVVKLGDEGAIMLDGARVLSAPAPKVELVDPIGAGDAFLSAFTLAGNQNAQDALTLATLWAGLSVQIHGTSPPALADLVARLES
jgi:D-beta-D-heptose 7-phosphate kinase/D-beta-D-heptose 1-phosphate adenosyltransferase